MKRKAKGLPPEAFDKVPRLQFTFTDETIWLTKFGSDGAPSVTYPVDARHIANAIHDFGASTGLLAPDTLWWTAKRGETEIAVWLPAVPRTIFFRVGRREHKIILPPLGCVFIGAGKAYRIFAALERPRTDRDQLYQVPLPNVYGDGSICHGSVPFPKCAAATIGQAAALFFESYFNQHVDAHRIQGDVPLLKQLQALSGKRKFPAELLIPARRVGELIGTTADGDDGDDELD